MHNPSAYKNSPPRKYRKELGDEVLVSKTVDKKALALRMLWRVYPIYAIPKSRKNDLKNLETKKEIYEFIDSADSEETEKLNEEIRQLKEEKH